MNHYEKTPVTYCEESGGKVSFDKKTAQTAKNDRMDRAHIPLRVYQCPGTDHWHLTSSVNREYKKTKFLKTQHAKILRPRILRPYTRF